MTSLASSCPRTPSCRTNIERSHSNSASSPDSQTVELKLPAGSGDEGGKDSKSTSQHDSKTNEEGEADSGDEAPGDGECQDGGGSDTESSSGSDEEAKGSSSDTGESRTRQMTQNLLTHPHHLTHLTLLDKNFSTWHTCMISEGCAGWEKHDTMTCNHRDPCKELRYPGPPLD